MTSSKRADNKKKSQNSRPKTSTPLQALADTFISSFKNILVQRRGPFKGLTAKSAIPTILATTGIIIGFQNCSDGFQSMKTGMPKTSSNGDSSSLSNETGKSCTFDGQTVQNGLSVTGYIYSSGTSSNLYCNLKLPLTCTNGTFGGLDSTYKYASCTQTLCAPNQIQACVAGNGIGSQTCNSSGSAFGSCSVKVCIPDSQQTCHLLTGEQGLMTCDSAGKNIGDCVATAQPPAHSCSASNCDVWLTNPRDFSKIASGNYQSLMPKRYCLKNDIDFVGDSQDVDTRAPRGELVGIEFNGCGYAIKNFNFNKQSLFDTLRYSSFHDVTFSSGNVNFQNYQGVRGSVGFVTNQAYSSDFSNIQFDNLTVSIAGGLIAGIGNPGNPLVACGIIAGDITASTLANISLTNSKIELGNCITAGALLGQYNDQLTLNAYSNGTNIYNSAKDIAGISGARRQVSNISVSSSQVSFTNQIFAGGVIGFVHGDVRNRTQLNLSNISFSGSINASCDVSLPVFACSQASTGGFFGTWGFALNPRIENSKFSGTISTNSIARVGGLAGSFLSSSLPVITNTSISGSVTAQSGQLGLTISSGKLAGNVKLSGLLHSEKNTASIKAKNDQGDIATLVGFYSNKNDDPVPASKVFDFCQIGNDFLPVDSIYSRYYSNQAADGQLCTDGWVEVGCNFTANGTLRTQFYFHSPAPFDFSKYDLTGGSQSNSINAAVEIYGSSSLSEKPLNIPKMNLALAVSSLWNHFSPTCRDRTGLNYGFNIRTPFENISAAQLKGLNVAPAAFYDVIMKIKQDTAGAVMSTTAIP